MDSLALLAERLESIVALVKAPWPNDVIVVAERAWNAYDRVRLKITSRLEATFAEYGVLRRAREDGTSVPDDVLAGSVERLGSDLDGIVTAIDRSERELFELVAVRSKADGELIEGQRTRDSELRSRIEAWRGALRADLRLASLPPAKDGGQMTPSSVSATATEVSTDTASTPTVVSSPPTSVATQDGASSETRSETAADVLVLYAEDPSLADGRPAPDAWGEASVVRHATDALPSLDGLGGRTYSMVVIYGSTGAVDDEGAPSVFNGHPRDASLDAFIEQLGACGLTTACLVVDFSESLYWIESLHPVLANDGVLIATTTRSEGVLSTAAAHVGAALPEDRSGPPLALAVTQRAEKLLSERHSEFFGSPHAVYDTRDRVLVRGGETGLFRYIAIDIGRAETDATSTTRALTRLGGLVGSDGVIVEDVHAYPDADVSDGFLDEVARRLRPPD